MIFHLVDARELKARVDLVAIAGQFTRLRRSGRQFVGLCPLHTERHPSFYVHRDKQVFYCFGCGAGGDVFAFVMSATGCDFRGALEIVAGFSEGVDRDSEPRSGSRLGTSEGGEAPSAREAGVPHSKFARDSRAQILVSLNRADRQLRAIEAANHAASAALATACEPRNEDEALLLETGE